MLKKCFKIDSEIYSSDVINKSIMDFEDITSITYEINNLTISGETEEEISEIFNEFFNYCTGVYNELI